VTENHRHRRRAAVSRPGPLSVQVPGRASKGRTWSTLTEIRRYRRWPPVCHLGHLSGAAPDRASETWSSLYKNLASHTALPVVDRWGDFAGFVFFSHGHVGFHDKRAAPA